MFSKRPVRYDMTRKVPVNYSTGRTKIQLTQYPSNFITTSKYTLISFFPFSLLGQFRRYANIYFLFIAIIQSIPIISPLTPFSAIAPLVFVLGLSMLREGMEDFRRHQSDTEVNAMPCTVIVDGKPMKSTWADIVVGDLLLVMQDEMFAADLVVLGSSIESGACYIETSSLDGEKNLKPKSAINETQKLFNTEQGSRDVVVLDARPPTPALGEYEGSIKIDSIQLSKSLGSKQLLLRGAFLRNTEWVLAAIIYTGEDTKIMRNAEAGRIKQSRIELMMNELILGILILQICLCTVSAVCASIWQYSNNTAHSSYVQAATDSISLNSFLIFFSYFLLYNTMIPISLVVSMEFVKVFQVYFIERDMEMYVESRKRYATANTSTINEELGMVEYIFSDKTGTLTCNQMEFKYCIVGDILYGQEAELDPNQVKLDGKVRVDGASQMNIKSGDIREEVEVFQHSVFNFKDTNLQGIIDRSEKHKALANHQINYKIYSNDGTTSMNFPSQKDLIDEYFFLLSSAHECLVQRDKITGAIIYQGPSPDEITLVDAAMRMGYKFMGASASRQEFEIKGVHKEIELLNSFEFDSTRKRMSVIVRDCGKYKLFIKGADNIIKQRLKVGQQPYLAYIDNQLSEFSKIGLRTLLMAMKVLSDQEFQEFDRLFNSYSNDADREQKINELTDKLEKDLYLLGATAVEDKLQPEVPETIADLLKAGIKVWMLTGDKLETAENIARSCRLIQGDMTVMRFSEPDKKSLTQKLLDNRETFNLCQKEKRKKSFLVEGETLAMIIEDKMIKREFVNMAQHCDSVVCCRVTPKQKAQVVRLIKEGLNKVTLAIGDGANDVNMIQEAHIGVGLYGNEGMRAVQSSDFALGEFRCLWRLLLVHGHWSYIRIAEMILYFFYKNMIFTVPQFFFAFYSAFSAQTYFDDWYITFYNLFFTAVPLIIRATFDQDINYVAKDHPQFPSQLNMFINKKEGYLKGKFPSLYYIGQKGTIFTFPNFIFWSIQGFLHGLFVFFVTFWCFGYGIMSKDGMPAGFAAISITAYTAIIFIVDIKIALYTKFWTKFNLIGILLLSIAVYMSYFVISNFILDTYTYHTPLQLLSYAQFYLVIALLIAIIFVFDVCFNQIIREIWPNIIDQMLKFKHKIRDIVHGENDSLRMGKDFQLPSKLEQDQLRKQELNLRPMWGDSFYELIVKDHQDQKKALEEQQELQELKL